MRRVLLLVALSSLAAVAPAQAQEVCALSDIGVCVGYDSTHAWVDPYCWNHHQITGCNEVDNLYFGRTLP
jgi:hypothetical protein